MEQIWVQVLVMFGFVLCFQQPEMTQENELSSHPKI